MNRRMLWAPSHAFLNDPPKRRPVGHHSFKAGRVYSAIADSEGTNSLPMIGWPGVTTLYGRRCAGRMSSGACWIRHFTTKAVVLPNLFPAKAAWIFVLAARNASCWGEWG